MEESAVYADLIRRLAAMKKDGLFSRGVYRLQAQPNDLMLASWEREGRKALGVFSLKGKAGVLPVDLPDGAYRNILDDQAVLVESGLLASRGEPIILLIEGTHGGNLC